MYHIKDGGLLKDVEDREEVIKRVSDQIKAGAALLTESSGLVQFNPDLVVAISAMR